MPVFSWNYGQFSFLWKDLGQDGKFFVIVACFDSNDYLVMIKWQLIQSKKKHVLVLGILQLFYWQKIQLKRQVPRNGRWLISEKQAFGSLLTLPRLSHKLPLPQPIIIILTSENPWQIQGVYDGFKNILTCFLSLLTLPLSLMPKWHFLGYFVYSIFWMERKTNFCNITWQKILFSLFEITL